MAEGARWLARWFGVGLAALLLLAACATVTPEEEAWSQETADTATSAPTAANPVTATPGPMPEDGYQIVTLLPPDAIPSIDEPQFYDVNEADLEYHPDELVLGVEFDGDARAYPIGLLVCREIVNDTVRSQPIAVTYSPLFFTGLVYSRKIEGEVTTFGVSGKLIRNVMVMYDRETGSLWSQLLGRAHKGRVRGHRVGLSALVDDDVAGMEGAACRHAGPDQGV